ncbi:MAG TPA: exonuclease domain-containing protein [Dermatophilaceae bacterium]|nr:exonuclease domain-containing protein [Dermatophilaceae bacterium]
MRWRRKGPDDRRLDALAKAAPGPLRDYLEVPFPDPSTPVEDLRLLAVDLETTGLDPRGGHVLSVGFVPVDGLTIDLSGARHLVVSSGAEVGQSATFHGLTDDAVAAGVPIAEALTEVLPALAGRVLLAHFAQIEQGFLSAACQRLWGAPMPCAVVDTMELQRRLVTTVFTVEPPTGAVRLWAARARFGLPVYRAHEALTDAVACAELYLAQVAEIADGGPPALRHVAL